MEECAELKGFTPFQAHELLLEVYVDHLHHNNGMHLDKGVVNEAIWQQCWRRLADQSAS